MEDAKNPQSQKDASDARMTSRYRTAKGHRGTAGRGGSPYLFGSAWDQRHIWLTPQSYGVESETHAL